MVILYLICFSLVLIYLMYPIWLRLFHNSREKCYSNDADIPGVSLIYLSFNGRNYLENKLNSLHEELKVFRNYEMIVIDGKSTDGSIEFLQSLPPDRNFRYIVEDDPQGVPHAMNLGVREARYDLVVFCDQRQVLSRNILSNIVAPLMDEHVGAVSACISHTDKTCYCSWVRKFENYIKEIESRSGNLVGVYGPLYAVKKSCYSSIPDNIILDDLYLSLKIMGRKKVLLHPQCLITDDGMAGIYNYDRAKRYLKGFLQILGDKNIWKPLSRRQIAMVIWHKYFRLLIPTVVFACIIMTGLYGISKPAYLVPFGLSLLLIVLSFIPVISRHFQPANILRINTLYFIASADILMNAFWGNRKIAGNPS